jgi:hypothetical protein
MIWEDNDLFDDIELHKSSGKKYKIHMRETDKEMRTTKF